MPAENYRIEVWSYAIGATGNEARHNFLVLVDGSGNRIRELHGGAAGPNGTMSDTALSGTVRVMEGIVANGVGPGTYNSNPIASVPGAASYGTARLETVVQEGSQADIMNRWDAANIAARDINAQNILYLPTPIPGVSGNSNGVANTLVQVASDVTYQGAPNELGTPGSADTLLSQSAINASRSAHGVPVRDGTEDVIIHERGDWNPETGQFDQRYLRLDGLTGEPTEITTRASTNQGAMNSLQTFEGDISDPVADTTITHFNSDGTIRDRLAYDYDSQGHLDSVHVENQNGTASHTAYGDDGVIDSYAVYDTAHRLDSVTTYTNNGVAYDRHLYDDAGLFDAREIYNLNGSFSQRFFYDDAGRVDYRYGYNLTGTLTSLTVYDDGSRMDDYFTYDATGRLDDRHSYDDFERVDSRELYNDQNQMVQRYFYDDSNRLDYRYTYDEMGRVDTVSCFDDAQVLRDFYEYDNNGHIDNRYIFDAAGHVDERQMFNDANGMTERFFYDDLERIDTRYSYDAAGRMDSQASYDDGETLRDFYAYDDSNRIDIRQTYDAAGRVDVLTSYDDAGRVDSMRDFAIDGTSSVNFYNDSNVLIDTDYFNGVGVETNPDIGGGVVYNPGPDPDPWVNDPWVYNPPAWDWDIGWDWW